MGGLEDGIVTQEGIPIPGFQANLRDRDNKISEAVTDRYKVAQNGDAFAFTDELLGEGVIYETAGSLQEEWASGGWKSCRSAISSAVMKSLRIWFYELP